MTTLIDGIEKTAVFSSNGDNPDFHIRFDKNRKDGCDDFDLGTKNYIAIIDSIVKKFGYSVALKKMMNDFNSYSEAIIIDFKWNSPIKFNRFSTKFNEIVKKVTITENIHYFRNKLNKAPQTLFELVKEKELWILLPPHKAAFHMNGKLGSWNLKFVSAGDARFEAVYDIKNNLLTESNDPINMGTYNYTNPMTDAPGHLRLDVEPFYKWSNTKDLPGRGQKIELALAANNLILFNNSVTAMKRWSYYNKIFNL